MVNRPSCTAVSNNGKAVSKPGKPGGGFSESFSSNVCGAWSVAKQSITSKFCQRASTSSFVARRGRTSLLPERGGEPAVEGRSSTTLPAARVAPLRKEISSFDKNK